MLNLIVANNPFNTKRFLTLFKKWNKILKRGGLEEIENFDLPNPVLKKSHNLRWKKEELIEHIVSTQNYYEKASEVLHTYPFKNENHQKIWELHCEGLSVRQIVLKIKKHPYKRMSVNRIITAIQKQSGLKA